MEHTEHQQFSSTGPIPVVTTPQAPEPASAQTTPPPLPKRRSSTNTMLIFGVIMFLGVALIAIGLLASRQQVVPQPPVTEVPVSVSSPTLAPTPTPNSPQAISARTKLDALGITLQGIDPYDPALSLPAAQSTLGF